MASAAASTTTKKREGWIPIKDHIMSESLLAVLREEEIEFNAATDGLFKTPDCSAFCWKRNNWCLCHRPSSCAMPEHSSMIEYRVSTLSVEFYCTCHNSGSKDEKRKNLIRCDERPDLLRGISTKRLHDIFNKFCAKYIVADDSAQVEVVEAVDLLFAMIPPDARVPKKTLTGIFKRKYNCRKNPGKGRHLFINGYRLLTQQAVRDAGVEYRVVGSGGKGGVAAAAATTARSAVVFEEDDEDAIATSSRFFARSANIVDDDDASDDSSFIVEDDDDSSTSSSSTSSSSSDDDEEEEGEKGQRLDDPEVYTRMKSEHDKESKDLEDLDARKKTEDDIYDLETVERVRVKRVRDEAYETDRHQLVSSIADKRRRIADHAAIVKEKAERDLHIAGLSKTESDEVHAFMESWKPIGPPSS
jgi:hypothetical protein